jgi:chemotaxis protein methyltransferase CheR
VTGDLTPTDVEQFRTLVAKRLGLEFDDSKVDQLAGVLRERLRFLGVRRLDTYIDKVMSFDAGGELGALAEQLTVGETYFFRNPTQFSALTEVILPQRLAERNARPDVQILSAGCASGEEAYSIAILLNEKHFALPGRVFKIHAIDINPTAIKKALRARYSKWSLRSTSAELRNRYFRCEDGDYLLEPAVRGMASFQVRNLLENDGAFWREGAFDVIFCRNVMMYFSDEVTRKVLERITRALVPGGCLFLGDAETLRGLSQEFHLQHTHGAFYYRRIDPCERRSRATAPWYEPPVVASGQPEGPPLAAADLFANIDRISRQIANPDFSERRFAAQVSSVSASRLLPAVAAKPSWDLRLAHELLQQERFADSIESLGQLPPQAKQDPDVLLLRAVLLTNSGKLIEAGEVCKQLLEVDEINAGAHYLMALCLEHIGDLAGATHQDQVAIYLDPSLSIAHFHLGLLARRGAKFEQARREVGQALFLLAREDAARILLFGGGFSRTALIEMCRAELQACGDLS